VKIKRRKRGLREKEGKRGKIEKGVKLEI